MTRRAALIIGVVAAGAVLFAAGSAFAFLGVREYRRAAWLETARKSFEDGDWQAASENLSRYLPHDPGNIELLTMYAEANARIFDDRPAALRNVAHAYHQILRYDPGNDEAQDRLLQLYERQGAWDVLEYYAADWLRKHPEDRSLLRARSIALDKSGSRDNAIAAYEALFRKYPGLQDELGRYAVLLRERSGAEIAERYLDELIAEQPDDAEALSAASQYWLAVGDIESAKHYLALANESAPGAAGHAALRARVAASERQWDDALSLLDTLPAEAETVALRANVLLASDNAEQAVALLEATQPEMRIDHPRLQVSLIDTLYDLGEIDGARREADVYLRAYPLDTATSNYIDGRDAMSEERFAEAADALAIAVEMRPDFRAARLALAVAELSAGDAAAGRGVLEAYLREYPADDRARALWSRHFGLDEREAERVAGLDAADSDALMAAAAVMAESAMREGTLADRAQAISDLARRAAQLSPDLVDAYRFEVGVWLRLGEAGHARQTVERAEQSNLDPTVLSELNGTIALSEGDIERAKEAFEGVRGQLDAAGFVAWARRFAAAGAYDEAIRVFATGESTLGETRFGIDRVELAAEFAPIDDAASVFTDGSTDTDPDRINRARLVLASRLADSQPDQRAEQLRELVSDLDGFNDPYVLAVHALEQLSRGNLDKSEVLLKEAERLAPGDVLVLDRLRALYEASSQPDSALAYAERVSAADPANDQYRLALGRLQAVNGLTTQAERTLHDVLSRAPLNSAVRQLLIEALLDAGRIEAAEAVLAELPENQRSDRLRSRVLIAQKAHGEAESLLRSRVAESPGDRAARWDLAVCLRETGRADEAETVLRDATQGENAGANDWAALARFLADMDADESLEHAARAALHALLIDPGHAETLRTLAGIRERQGDPAAALAVLRRYTAVREGDAQAWYRRSQLELAAGSRWADALRSVEKAYAIDKDAEYRALRGYIHAGMKNYDVAIADLEEAAADLPATSVQFDLTLAECYFFTDRIEQAEFRVSTAERKLALRGTTDNSRLAVLKDRLAARSEVE